MLDIINPEFDITMSGNSFKLKALSLNSLLKLSKQLRTKEKISNAKEMCKHLPANQQSKFMMDVLVQMDKPQKLEEELAFADSVFQSISGIAEIVKFSILKYNKIDEDKLDEIIDDNVSADNFEYLAEIAQRLLGIADSEEEVADSDDSEKKNEQIESTEQKVQ